MHKDVLKLKEQRYQYHRIICKLYLPSRSTIKHLPYIYKYYQILNYIVLYIIILYFVILCYIILYYIILCYIIWFYIILYVLILKLYIIILYHILFWYIYIYMYIPAFPISRLPTFVRSRTWRRALLAAPRDASSWAPWRPRWTARSWVGWSRRWRT